jgi:hypothetical protein
MDEYESLNHTKWECKYMLCCKRQGGCIWRVPLSSGKLAA